MAKKRSKKTPTKKSPSPRTSRGNSATVTKDRDKKTLMKIDALAGAVVKSSLAQRDPHVDIPMRTVSNTRFNKSKRILEMGSNAQRRNLFNLSMAKKFMQTVLLADGCKDLIEAGKTLSLRGMYYKSLHTIEGTNEKTFNAQSESDPVL